MKEYTDKELTAMDRKTFHRAFFKRFKKFLKHAKYPMQSLMCFGCETDRGWNAIIWHLTEAIEKVPTKSKEFEIVQVKEKFGGLRYYVEGGGEGVYELIDEAEKLAWHTCEKCGEPGKLDSRYGWYLTLCKPCMKLRAEEKEAEKVIK